MDDFIVKSQLLKIKKGLVKKGADFFEDSSLTNKKNKLLVAYFRQFHKTLNIL